MTRREFRQNVGRANLVKGLSSNPYTKDYAKGYLLGLRSYYHGEKFATPEEHQFWLCLGLEGDHCKALGDGYRVGFAGIPFALPAGLADEAAND